MKWIFWKKKQKWQNVTILSKFVSKFTRKMGKNDNSVLTLRLLLEMIKKFQKIFWCTAHEIVLKKTKYQNLMIFMKFISNMLNYYWDRWRITWKSDKNDSFTLPVTRYSILKLSYFFLKVVNMTWTQGSCFFIPPSPQSQKKSSKTYQNYF